MKSKYRFNVRKLTHKKRNRSLAIYLIIVCLLVLGAWIIAHFELHPSTAIKDAKANTLKYSATTSTSIYKVYKASDFSFKMSSGWSSVVIPNSPYHLYEWQTGSGANYQTVQIFEDSNTTNLAVNRVIIVGANGNQISVLSSPSDNCSNFTNGTKTSTLTGYPAKWQSVAFNCDLNNPTRDVVGISSAQTINSVNLISSSGTHHSFYFLYTDHSLTPSYSDFEELLSSFQLQ